MEEDLLKEVLDNSLVMDGSEKILPFQLTMKDNLIPNEDIFPKSEEISNINQKTLEGNEKKELAVKENLLSNNINTKLDFIENMLDFKANSKMGNKIYDQIKDTQIKDTE